MQVDTTASDRPGFRELGMSPRSLEEELQAMLQQRHSEMALSSIRGQCKKLIGLAIIKVRSFHIPTQNRFRVAYREVLGGGEMSVIGLLGLGGVAGAAGTTAVTGDF